MQRLQRERGVIANPILIGAVTVLVAIVAVFLAYNANNGLPFVPTRELKVDFPNGAALVAGNDVEQGSYRIGLVAEMHPVVGPNGQILVTRRDRIGSLLHEYRRAA